MKRSINCVQLRPLLAHPLGLFIAVFLTFGYPHNHAQADIVDLAVGSKQICLLDDEYELRCKTKISADRLLPPENMPDLVSIAAGNAHFCGLTSAGSVYCFGDNDFGQTSHESVTLSHRYRDISAGGNFSCATRVSGLQIDCWGDVSEQLPSTLNDYLSSSLGSSVEDINLTVLGSRNICWLASLNPNVATPNNPRDTLQCWETGRGFYQILDFSRGRFVSASNDDVLHCVITGNGGITCLEDIGWGREFRNTSFNRAGPYAQVAVSGGVVCVLTTSGQLDCDTSLYEGDSPGREERRISATINARVDELADTRFTHLEPYHVYFNNGGRAFCLTDTQNELHCIGEGEFNTLSVSEQNPNWIDTGTLNGGNSSSLLAINNIAVYSHGIVELFWEPQVDFNDYSHVEIFRDGILLTTTTNADSYYDNTLQGDTTYSYEIREVRNDGSVGTLSDAYLVSTPGDYTVYTDFNEMPTGCESGTLTPPIALRVASYGTNSGELFWQTGMYQRSIDVGFNIFVNGTQLNSEPLDNNGSFFLYGDEQFNSTFSYALRAVDGCGRVSELSNEVRP